VNTEDIRPVLANERASCMKQFSAQIEIQEPNLLVRQQEAAAREERFTAVVERRSRFVFRVAYALLRNSYDAEDGRSCCLREQFPTPTPLTDEERALLAFVAQSPKQAEEVLADAKSRSSKPIEIKEIQLEPLPDGGQ
jgi:hypothetical protein